MKRKLKFNLKTNSIVCGDCAEWLQYIPDNSIDLIYIDPPFFSNKNYEIVWGNGFEVRSFADRWQGGIRHYIEWMRPKIKEAKRVLKNTGAIYLHCDKHASHYLRILLDSVFGEKNFKNEIIWYYKGGLKNTYKIFPQKHDNIYFYTKSNDYFFNLMRKQTEDKKSVSLWKRWGKYSSDGVNIRLSEIPETDTINRQRQMNKFKNKNKRNPKPNDILYTLEFPLLEDVWDDCSPVYRLKEKIGYITQKPEALLNRIIQSSTKENDLVLDFFAGGGTTAKVCADLNRLFIVGDVSPVAVRVMGDRLISNGYNQYEVKSLPSTKEEYLLMDGHKFADMICEFMGWEPNAKKSGDGGIDGWANKGKIAVQIKNQKNKIGRPEIQKFLGALTDYDTGIFVAWGFAPSAWEYKAKVKNKRNSIYRSK